MTRSEFNLWAATFKDHFPGVAQWIRRQKNAQGITDSWFNLLKNCSLEHADRATHEMAADPATKILGWQHYAADVLERCKVYEQRQRPPEARIPPPKAKPGVLAPSIEKVLKAARGLRGRQAGRWQEMTQKQRIMASRLFRQDIEDIGKQAETVADQTDQTIAYIEAQ